MPPAVRDQDLHLPQYILYLYPLFAVPDAIQLSVAQPQLMQHQHLQQQLPPPTQQYQIFPPLPAGPPQQTAQGTAPAPSPADYNAGGQGQQPGWS